MKPPFEASPTYQADQHVDAWFPIVDANNVEVCRVVFPDAAHQDEAQQRAETLTRMLNLAIEAASCDNCKHNDGTPDFNNHCIKTKCSVNPRINPGWELK